MAKRKQLFHPDEVREKIKASQLCNRLHAHAFGEIELTATQVKSIEILLRKSMPDLSAAEVVSEITHRYVARVPSKAPDAKTWQQANAPVVDDATRH